jgi:uncharacterized protein (DUF4415 family)
MIMAKKIGEAQALKEINEALKAPRKDHKIRITTMIDGDVLDNLKKKAEDEGVKYQTLLNNILRDTLVLNKKDPIKVILARLNKLEKLVLEKETA